MKLTDDQRFRLVTALHRGERLCVHLVAATVRDDLTLRESLRQWWDMRHDHAVEALEIMFGRKLYEEMRDHNDPHINAKGGDA